MTAAAAIIISPDSLLIRLVEADTSTILFWRAALSAIALLAWLSWRHGASVLPWLGARLRDNAILALLMAVGNVLFVTSIKTTAVANTLAIVAATPFFAALFSRLLLGERLMPATLMAIVSAVGGVILIVGGGMQTAGLLGNFLALGAALVMGLYLTLFRVWRRGDPLIALFLGFVFLACGALLTVPPELMTVMTGSSAIYLLAMGILIMPTANLLRLMALKHIPSADVGMVFLLETALAPIWVWLALNEIPPPTTAAGGGIIILTLLTYGLATRRRPARLSDS